MPTSSRTRVPSYRFHKPTGQAVVTLNGRDIYLGEHGTAASREKYDRITAEWLAQGRQLHAASSHQTSQSIMQVCLAFKRHAETYYRKPDGTPTSELNTIGQAVRVLRELYGRTPAAEFDVLKLKAVRDAMVRKGWCRSYVNKQVSRLKSVFRWAVENKLLPASVHHEIITLKGLKRGRTEAKERAKIVPVPDEIVAATLPHLSRVVRAMVEVQLTGMRPGETCAMRSIDIDTSGKVWRYVPKEHKTEHFDIDRIVYLGPQAQHVIRPFLKTDVTAYLFDPREAEAEWLAEKHSARKTPLSCGNVPGSNRRRCPKRAPGACYDTPSYRRAIARGCDRVFPPPAHLRRREWMEADRVKRETAAAHLARLTPEQLAELAKWRKEHRLAPASIAAHCRDETPPGIRLGDSAGDLGSQDA